MLLWLGFAVMTALVVAVLLRPLWRPDVKVLAPAEADLAVYRDQLNEIDADRERGLIGVAEAEGAKTELARRILVHAADAKDDVTEPQGRSNLFPLVTAALVPLASLALYLWIGSPMLPDSPLEARKSVPIEQATIDELIGKVEARLAKHPNDAEGWSVIAPIYLRVGRYDDAANAFARILMLKGETAQGLVRFAEATVMANNGTVTEPARRAFARVVELEPDRPEAQFGLALAKEQAGDLTGAQSDFKSLLAGAPAEATWRPALEERIKDIEQRLAAAGPSTSPAPAPPQAAPLQAGRKQRTPEEIAKMGQAEREKTIIAMVDGLAARLKAHGDDLEGWLRLIRAYNVLGREQDATTALTDARRNFASDAKALGEIDALAKSLNMAP